MGRPATQHEERKAQIIAAAMEVFAQKGYDGTTNRLIAEAAGLRSVTLIYHYFPSKTDLFKACLYQVSILQDLHQQIEQGQEEIPEVYLRRVGLAYLNALQAKHSSRLMLMVLTAAQSHPELIPILMSRMTEAVIFPLFRYFSHQMDQGRLKHMPAVSAAQQYMGGLFFRALVVNLLGRELPFDMPPEETFIDQYVKVFLEGICRQSG